MKWVPHDPYNWYPTLNACQTICPVSKNMHTCAHMQMPCLMYAPIALELPATLDFKVQLSCTLENEEVR